MKPCLLFTFKPEQRHQSITRHQWVNTSCRFFLFVCCFLFFFYSLHKYVNEVCFHSFIQLSRTDVSVCRFSLTQCVLLVLPTVYWSPVFTLKCSDWACVCPVVLFYFLPAVGFKFLPPWALKKYSNHVFFVTLINRKHFKWPTTEMR